MTSYCMVVVRRGMSTLPHMTHMSSKHGAIKPCINPYISQIRPLFKSTRLFSSPPPSSSTPTPTITRLPRSNTPLHLTCGYSSPTTIASNLPLIISHCQSRSSPQSLIDELRKIEELSKRRVELIKERDTHLATRNSKSKEVGLAMKSGDKELASSLKSESTLASSKADSAEEELASVDGIINSIMLSTPNLLDDVVPEGVNEDDNVVVSSWGEIGDVRARMGWKDEFVPKWHDEVAEGLLGWEGERATKISGARFTALKGHVAQMERAIYTWFLDLAASRSYTEVSVPTVVSRSTLTNTGQLPKFEEDLFRVSESSHSCNGEQAFLIPTGEVPLTNLHAGEILNEDELPVMYVAYTKCYRAEAGSYGRDTRGLIRTHEFGKVELVKITKPEDSSSEHMKLVEDAEMCLRGLELPYRKVKLCSGDIGFGAELCYDLEVWMPGQGEWREISSCSNMGDFQSRRMGLRYRPSPSVDSKGSKKKGKPKPQLCHTINGSGLAVGRALVAVLENYQMEDGRVRVPKVLQPYMNGMEILGESTE
eukprot:CAMPEP_0118645282 /NCGR_PEP_ID=MMETSP0785-20121206/7414_1 /TAXON_ID=91992 /ORGANISM="Bolidomonas pacifica, Strain CCMP 1866" /LENGTH=537 /DNA_ID=CAMNT_0006537147 /DNA_START=88 /DNA_END=1701 /DNA_ORIENTATION=-